MAESLLALAPLRLPNRRRTRYLADDLCISLEQVAGTDRALLVRLYATLGKLLHAIADPATDDAGKWRGVARWSQPRDLDARIDEVRELGAACRYEGALTECCLESAALDRIFYNLANNACRHAATDQLEMAIFPIPQPPGDCLRFVLSNEVGETDAASLHSLLRHGGADSVDRGSGASLFRLFEPAVSSTGSGFGLTVVAEFVAGAFGLRNRAEALRERYVGAVLESCTFRVWFHWPMASDEHPQKLDDFHRPEESLSEARVVLWPTGL